MTWTQIQCPFQRSQPWGSNVMCVRNVYARAKAEGKGMVSVIAHFSRF